MSFMINTKIDSVPFSTSANNVTIENGITDITSKMDTIDDKITKQNAYQIKQMKKYRWLSGRKRHR